MTIKRERPRGIGTNQAVRDVVYCDVMGCQQNSVMTKTARLLWCELTMPSVGEGELHLCPKHSDSAVQKGEDVRVKHPATGQVVTLPASAVPPLPRHVHDAIVREAGIVATPDQAREARAKLTAEQRQRLEEAEQAARLWASDTDTDALDI